MMITRLLRIIFALMLVCTLGSVASYVSSSETVSVDDASLVTSRAIHMAEGTDAPSAFSTPALPYMPDAEMGACGFVNQFFFSLRAQRSQLLHYLQVMRSSLELISHRMAQISHLQEKGYHMLSLTFARHACEYYVYALRHIII